LEEGIAVDRVVVVVVEEADEGVAKATAVFLLIAA
jgi:hypothetical protein